MSACRMNRVRWCRYFLVCTIGLIGGLLSISLWLSSCMPPMPCPGLDQNNCLTASLKDYQNANEACERNPPPPDGSLSLKLCRGESFFIYWKSTDFNEVQITENGTDYGTFPLEQGKQKITPPKSGTYQVTLKGQCEITLEVTVVLVDDSQTETLLAKGNADSGFEINISEDTTSARFVVKSIRAVPCLGSSVFWPRWSCKKTNPAGTSVYFDVDQTASSANCVLLVGKWRFSPRDSYPPGIGGETTACFEVAFDCISCTTPTPTPTPFPTPYPGDNGFPQRSSLVR